MWTYGVRRMGRRALSTLIAAVMLLSVTTGGALAAFEDVPAAHWAAAAIQRWQSCGVMQGDGHGFRPEDNVTRGEAAVVLDRLAGPELQAENVYADLPDGAYYTAPMLRLSAAGLMQGDGAGMRPGGVVTRQELAVLLARLFALEGAGQPEYADGGSIAPWARDAVAAVSARGWFQGNRGNFRPNDPLTRAELAQVLDRCVSLFLTQDARPEAAPEGICVVKGGTLTLSGARLEDTLLIGGGGSAVLSGGRAACVLLLGGARLTLEGDACVDRIVVGAGASLSNVTASRNAAVAATELRPGALEGQIRRPSGDRDSGGGHEETPGPVLISLNYSGAVLDGGAEGKHYDQVLVGPGVGDGEVTLVNLTVGQLLVMGGGAHSVVLQNTSVQSATVDKEGGEPPALKLDGASSVEALAFRSDGSVLGTDGAPAVDFVAVAEGRAARLEHVAVSQAVTAGSLTVKDAAVETLSVAGGTTPAGVALTGETQVGLLVVEEAVTAQPSLACGSDTPPATLVVKSAAGAAVTGPQKPTETFAATEAARDNITGVEKVSVGTDVAVGLAAQPQDLSVPGGTEFAALALPETLEVLLLDGGSAVLPVAWAPGDYNPNPDVLSTFTLTGALDLSQHPDMAVAASCKITLRVTVDMPVRAVTVAAPDLPRQFSVGKAVSVRYVLSAPGLTAGDITVQAASPANVTVANVRAVQSGADTVAVTADVTGAAPAQAARLELIRAASASAYYTLPAPTLGGTFSVAATQDLFDFSGTPVLSLQHGKPCVQIGLERPVPEGAQFTLKGELYYEYQTQQRFTFSADSGSGLPWYSLSPQRTTLTLCLGDQLSALDGAGKYLLEVTAKPAGATLEGGLYSESRTVTDAIRSEKPTLDNLFEYICLGDSTKLSQDNLEGTRYRTVQGGQTDFYFTTGKWSGDIAYLQYSADGQAWADCFSAETRKQLLAGGSAVLFRYDKPLAQGSALYFRVNDPKAAPYAISGGVLTVTALPTHRVIWSYTGALTLNDQGAAVTAENVMDESSFRFKTADVLNGALKQEAVARDFYQISYTQDGEKVVRTLVGTAQTSGQLGTYENYFAPGAQVAFSRIDGVNTYTVTHIVMLQEAGATALRTITGNSSSTALHSVFKFADTADSFKPDSVTMSGKLDGAQKNMTVAVSGLPTGYTYYTSPSGEETLAVSGGEAVLTVPLNGGGDTGARTVYALPDAPASSNLFTYTARVEAFSVTCARKAPDGAANSCKISSVDGSYAYLDSLGLILNQELPQGSKIELTDKDGQPYTLPDGASTLPFSGSRINASGLLAAEGISGENYLQLVVTPAAGTATRDGSAFTLYAEQSPSYLRYNGRALVPTVDQEKDPIRNGDGTTTIPMAVPEGIHENQTAAIVYIPEMGYWKDIPLEDNTLTVKDGGTLPLAASGQLIGDSGRAFVSQSDGVAYKVSPYAAPSLNLSHYFYSSISIQDVSASPYEHSYKTVSDGYFLVNTWDGMDLSGLKVKLPGADSYVPLESTDPDMPKTPFKLDATEKNKINFVGLVSPDGEAVYEFGLSAVYSTSGDTIYIKGGGSSKIILTPTPRVEIDGIGYRSDDSGYFLLNMPKANGKYVSFMTALDAEGNAYSLDTSKFNMSGAWEALLKSDGGTGAAINTEQAAPGAINLIYRMKYTVNTPIDGDRTVTISGNPLTVSTQPGGARVAAPEIALFGHGMIPNFSNSALCITSSALTADSTVDVYARAGSQAEWTLHQKDLKPAYSQSGNYYVECSQENGFQANQQIYLVARSQDEAYDKNSGWYTFAGSASETPTPTQTQILSILPAKSYADYTFDVRSGPSSEGESGLFFTPGDAFYRTITCYMGNQELSTLSGGRFFISLADLNPGSTEGTLNFRFSSLPYLSGSDRGGVCINDLNGENNTAVVRYTVTAGEPAIASITALDAGDGRAPGEAYDIAMRDTAVDYTLYDETGKVIERSSLGHLYVTPSRCATDTAYIQSGQCTVNNNTRTITLSGRTKLSLSPVEDKGTAAENKFSRTVTGIIIDENDPQKVVSVTVTPKWTDETVTACWGLRGGKDYQTLTSGTAIEVPYDLNSSGSEYYATYLLRQPEYVEGVGWTIYRTACGPLQFSPDTPVCDSIADIRLQCSEDGALEYVLTLAALGERRMTTGVLFNGVVYGVERDSSGAATVTIPYGDYSALKDELYSLPCFNQMFVHPVTRFDTENLDWFAPVSQTAATLEGQTLTVELTSDGPYQTGENAACVEFGDSYYAAGVTDSGNGVYTLSATVAVDPEGTPGSVYVYRAPYAENGTIHVDTTPIVVSLTKKEE